MERFGFRRLEVYQLSMAMVREVVGLMRMLPRDQMDLVWQTRRAARSVVLNVAEGAGEFAPKEKARFYRIARRSAWETVAALDMALDNQLLDERATAHAVDLLDSIVGQLTTMTKRVESRVPVAHSTTRPIRDSGAQPSRRRPPPPPR